MTKNEWEDRAGFFLLAHAVADFTASEVCDVGRVEDGVELTDPYPTLMPNAITLIDGPLNWIRAFRGTEPVTVNSWYRSTDYNHAVGGTEHSMHLTCGAADITKAGWTPDAVAFALVNEYGDAAGLGIGLYKTFVHVDIRGRIGRPAPARWAGDGVDPDWWKVTAQ